MKAFPTPTLEIKMDGSVAGYQRGNEGMDLRDYFAGHALQGLLANGTIGMQLPPKNVCERAYAHADWMIKVRDQNDS